MITDPSINESNLLNSREVEFVSLELENLHVTIPSYFTVFSNGFIVHMSNKVVNNAKKHCSRNPAKLIFSNKN